MRQLKGCVAVANEHRPGMVRSTKQIPVSVKEGQVLGKNGAMVRPNKPLTKEIRDEYEYFMLEQNEIEEKIKIEEQIRKQTKRKPINIFKESLKREIRKERADRREKRMLWREVEMARKSRENKR